MARSIRILLIFDQSILYQNRFVGKQNKCCSVKCVVLVKVVGIDVFKIHLKSIITKNLGFSK